MQFSVFAFTLLFVLPSILSAIVFVRMKIPLKISFDEPSLPLQLFFLGFLLPFVPYVMAVMIVKSVWSLNGLTPLFFMFGFKSMTADMFLSGALKWSVFFFVYFLFCIGLAFFMGLIINQYPLIFAILEKFKLIDEVKYPENYANKVNIFVDVITNDGNWIYSGKLSGGMAKVYFQQGVLMLMDVLKIPKDKSHLDVETYKIQESLAGNLRSESFLSEMCFPKNNITSLNIRVDPKSKSNRIEFPR